MVMIIICYASLMPMPAWCLSLVVVGADGQLPMLGMAVVKSLLHLCTSVFVIVVVVVIISSGGGVV